MSEDHKEMKYDRDSHIEHEEYEYEIHTEHKRHNHQEHHAHTVADFKRRFWISLVFTVPILILSPMVQRLVGLGELIRFTGDSYLLFAISSFVFVYGGYPFLKGLVVAINARIPRRRALPG